MPVNLDQKTHRRIEKMSMRGGNQNLLTGASLLRNRRNPSLHPGEQKVPKESGICIENG